MLALQNTKEGMIKSGGKNRNTGVQRKKWSVF